jgi:nitrate/nitrite transport system permease protein
MVSAVFHSPLATAAEDVAVMKVATPAVAPKAAAPALREHAKPGFDWNGLLMSVMPPVLGMVLLVLIWSMVSMGTAGSIPTPIDTLKQAMDIFSDPFYRKGPNDQGVGWNVLASLQRVALAWRPSSASRRAL